ncbi:dioxygenase [Candidatus Scalindua japonica]|uniref:MEMO1 family protein SCALIN_C22_0108 n=1 Tax=Candidatus Scalindua japonica TaxID=1284222 RepID=A0A286TZV7_9BACT|nr:AmmeMemoRadiSam system protein B [Candidatus Scalindua japonica]GAX61398.1 dioxygenase [Candidatus Scalindua japonica]
MNRLPVASGSFYPGNKEELQSALKVLMEDYPERQRALGVISPHAGYVYSGRVMGSVFSRIEVPDTVVLLAPNHTGRGVPFSVWPEGNWHTPLGDTSIDEELVSEILNRCELIEKDEIAHNKEHSAEVILPFLQYSNLQVKIAVIVIRSGNIEELRIVGKSIGDVLKKLRPDALVVASSDMTHYESKQSADKKDKSAIAEIVALREDGLYNVVRALDISMCGVSPVISMMVCSKERGAVKAELIKYETSGETTGDYKQVVGYAGLIIK